MASKVGRMSSVAIYLVRNDLRIHDNECLQWCVQNANIVIPLFCFDCTMYGPDTLTWTYKLPRTSVHRMRFLLESVIDLRDMFRKLGCDLLVRNGQSITYAVSEVIRLCKENTTGKRAGKTKLDLKEKFTFYCLVQTFHRPLNMN